MTLITFQDGKPLMKDGKVGTEQDCCCEPGGGGSDGEGEGENLCDSADQASQPSVVVTGSTCSCETGTHNGTYPFVAYSASGGYQWGGTTNCDVQEDAFGTVFLTPLGVVVSCDFFVSVNTYELSDGGLPSGMSGTADGATSLSVDEDGHITGQVTVDLSGAGGNACSVTVTFG